MVHFNTPFDEAPDLSSASSVRRAMRQSYDRYREMAKVAALPPDTTDHEAAMYGTLTSYYELFGANPAQVARHGSVFWLEVLPFLHLPKDAGVEALAEYIVWKHKPTRDEARVEWLVERIQAGVTEAVADGRRSEVLEATRVPGLGPLPWVRLTLAVGS